MDSDELDGSQPTADGAEASDRAHGPDEARCKAETQRLAALLVSLAGSKKISMRALEKKVGVGDSVFAKVVSGKVTLQMRHILLMCDGLGVEWGDFFAQAYPKHFAKVAEVEEQKRFRSYLIKVGLLPPDFEEPSSPGE